MPRRTQEADGWQRDVMDSLHATLEDVGDGLGWAYSQVGPFIQGAFDAPKAAAQGVNIGVQGLPLPGHNVHCRDPRDDCFRRLTKADGTPIDSDPNDPDNWAWDSLKNMKRGHESTDVTAFYRRQAPPEDVTGDPRVWNWDAVPEGLRTTPVQTPEPNKFM